MRAMPRGSLAVGCVAVAVSITGCGGSPITSRRIERDVAPTFANLVHLELERVGLPSVPAARLAVKSGCRKLLPQTGLTGAGDWVCTLVWSGPNGVPLTDTYDVVVSTNGCYTATVEGAEAALGGPIVPGPDGRPTRNLLYAFEGCFDTSH
jgi:hypothetical protein